MLPENHSELEALLSSRRYLGFDDVPIGIGKKSPSATGWPSIEQFGWAAFAGKNIGCRGTWIIPIDVDEELTSYCVLSVLGSAFPSGVLFDGRPSRSVGHVYVRVPDGAPRTSRKASPIELANYPAPVGVEAGSYVIELKHHRGLQAVTAPSVHPSGEALSWRLGALSSWQEIDVVLDSMVPVMPAAELVRRLRCAWVARALLVLWHEGVRHNLCLWAGSWLYAYGVSEDDAALIVRVLVDVAAVGGLSGSSEDTTGFVTAFMTDWRKPPVATSSAARKGRSGVGELVEHVLGAGQASLWFDRVYRVWPELGRGFASGVPALPDSALGGPVSTGVQPGTPVNNGGLTQEEIDQNAAADRELERMRARCTFISAAGGGGLIHDLDTGVVESLSSFQNHTTHLMTVSPRGPRGGQSKGVALVTRWLGLADKRKAFGTAYLPGHPYGAIVDRVVNTFRRGPVWDAVYERWRLEALVEPSEIAVGWWLDWVCRVIPDARERYWFHRWVAHLLVHPERLPGWALYMTTPVEGVGRTSMAVVLTRIMGKDNCRAVSMEEIKSGYTNWAADSVFRYANEIRETGQSRGTVAARLQDAITDAMLGVTRKYEPSVQVSNFGGYLLISNSTGDFHLRGVARRYCCISNGVAPPTDEERQAFFSRWGDPAALEAVCEMYFNRWVAEPSLPARAPETATFAQVVEDSATEAEFTIEEAAAMLGDLFTIRQLGRWLDGPLADIKHDKSRQAKLRNMLRAAGYKQVAQIRTDQGQERVFAPALLYGAKCRLSHDKLRAVLSDVDAVLAGEKVLQSKGSNVIDFNKNKEED